MQARRCDERLGCRLWTQASMIVQEGRAQPGGTCWGGEDKRRHRLICAEGGKGKKDSLQNGSSAAGSDCTDLTGWQSFMAAVQAFCTPECLFPQRPKFEQKPTKISSLINTITDVSCQAELLQKVYAETHSSGGGRGVLNFVMSQRELRPLTT